MLRKVAFIVALATLMAAPLQSAAEPDAAPAAPTAAVADAGGAATTAPASATKVPATTTDDAKKEETKQPTSLPTVDPEKPGEMVSSIFQAIKEGKWAWLVGLIFMLLTWVFNKLLKEKIPAKALPWVAIGLGVGTNIAMSFATGMVWYEAIGNGVSLGLAAAGGWSALGKHILPTKAKEA